MQEEPAVPALGSSPSGDAAERSEDRSRSDCGDLGDLVIVLLAGTLAGLRDDLEQDGFHQAAALVADLACRCDDFVGQGPR